MNFVLLIYDCIKILEIIWVVRSIRLLVEVYFGVQIIYIFISIEKKVMHRCRLKCLLHYQYTEIIIVT